MQDPRERNNNFRLRAVLDRQRSRRWSLPHPDEVTAVHGEPLAPGFGHAGLGHAGLRVLVWNVFKGKRPSWAHEFGPMARSSDLVLAQELYFEAQTHALLRDSSLQWTTATSFTYARRGGIGTGLGTAARAASRHMHALLTAGREPLTRTPKLALLTSYGLGHGHGHGHHPGARDDLLVVNVHAINFAGFASFDAQLERIEAAIADHRGPLLVAGDFNTWTGRRQRRLDALVRATSLEPVEFADDPRTTKLDHAFVRGLRASSGRVHDSRASDHAALTFDVELV